MNTARCNSVFRDVNSSDVVKSVFEVHFSEASSVADLTYGKGAFWKNVPENLTVVSLDQNPRYGCLVKSDCRSVPLGDQSVDVVVFDPPHQHGVSLSTTLRQQEDFGRLSSQTEIHALVRDTAPEIRRISRVGAIIKITDMVEGGRFMPSHILIASSLSPVLGWPADMAILDSGVVRPTNHERVLHLRHAHSYFMVYKWNEKTPRSCLVRPTVERLKGFVFAATGA